MKNKEKVKPTKRKILAYYLSLAACVLIIASIVIGVVFAFKGKSDVSIDNTGGTQTDEGNNNVIDTSSSYKFISPISAEVSKAHAFCHDETMDKYCLHRAMDFNAPAGTEVYAAVDGTVTKVMVNSVFYTSYITIRHANGIETVYKFVTPAEGLKEGAVINRGDVIATVAPAGGIENKQGDHLHFEVHKDGRAQNPDDYLLLGAK